MEQEAKIFTPEEIQMLRKRCDKVLEIYANSGPQEIWTAILGNQTEIIPAIYEKMLEEMKQTNQALNTLIQTQERLCKAIEDIIDLELESEEAQASQKKVEYFFPQTLFDRNATQNESHHPHDPELYLR